MTQTIADPRRARDRARRRRHRRAGGAARRARDPTGRPRLRRGAPRLERHDRPPARRSSSAAPGRRRRRRGRPLRARARCFPSPSAAAATASPDCAVCDGAIVVDLSRMRGVEVDPERAARARRRRQPARRRRRRDAGARPRRAVRRRLADRDRGPDALGRDGLAAPQPTGSPPTTSSRPRSSRPTAASCAPREDEHPELFWALRGGGGNFGVVTSFEYRLHPVGPEVAVAFVLYPGERAVEVMRRVRRVHGRGAGGGRARCCFLGRVPHADMFPAEAHGQPYVAIAGVHPGAGRGGRAGAAAAARARRPDRRPQRRDAVRRGPEAPRRGLPRRLALLLEVARARRALADEVVRPAHRARGRRPVRPLDDRRLVARRRDGPRPGGGDCVRRAGRTILLGYEANFEDAGRGGRRTSPGCATRSRSCGRSRPAAPTSTSPASSRRATSCCARRSARRTTSGWSR